MMNQPPHPTDTLSRRQEKHIDANWKQTNVKQLAHLYSKINKEDEDFADEFAARLMLMQSGDKLFRGSVPTMEYENIVGICDSQS